MDTERTRPELVSTVKDRHKMGGGIVASSHQAGGITCQHVRASANNV
jgi:hypothetical protein